MARDDSRQTDPLRHGSRYNRERDVRDPARRPDPRPALDAVARCHLWCSDGNRQVVGRADGRTFNVRRQRRITFVEHEHRP